MIFQALQFIMAAAWHVLIAPGIVKRNRRRFCDSYAETKRARTLH
jgi:hypothetical protein